MYLYTELWNFRPAWRALSPEARQRWMDTMLVGLQQQLASGVEVVGFVTSDSDTPHHSGFDFMATWKLPDKPAAVAFEAFVEASGFHTYFEQVNTRGAAMEMDAVVEAMLNP